MKEKLLIIWRRLLLISLMVAMSPLVIVIRILRPFVIIRFGELIARRVGHFSGDTEMYLCERNTGKYPRNTFDIFFYRNPVSNQQLLTMWRRTLRIWNFWIAYPIYRANLIFPSFSAHTIKIPSNRDVQGLLAITPVHLYFTQEEEECGQAQLLKLGIARGREFVCFIARDSAYLDTVYPQHNWHNHNYRDSSVSNYLPAAEELTRRGYFALRMGAIVKQALDTPNKMIIDYATKYRTEFLDIYLSSKCRFFIGSGCGIDEVPAVFRRPIMLVNYIPIEYVHTWHPVYLFITKKIWSKKDGRFLSYKEIISSGIGSFGKEESDEYEKLGFEIVENTPEEIFDLAVEMDERLKGTWRDSPEDEELQMSFRSVFSSSNKHGKIVSRIGSEFLRKNKALLG